MNFSPRPRRFMHQTQATGVIVSSHKISRLFICFRYFHCYPVFSISAFPFTIQHTCSAKNRTDLCHTTFGFSAYDRSEDERPIMLLRPSSSNLLSLTLLRSIKADLKNDPSDSGVRHVDDKLCDRSLTAGSTKPPLTAWYEQLRIHNPTSPETRSAPHVPHS